MAQRIATLINLSFHYRLIGGITVRSRGDDVVQIGSEAPHWLILRHAPAHSIDILRCLDGTSPAAAVLRFHQADLHLWTGLLTELRDAGLLILPEQSSCNGATPGPFLEPERISLVHRHGIAVARRVLRARQDAVVVVRGTGRVATAVAASLASSGVGHVHQQPDRALRVTDLPEQEPAATGRSRAPTGADAPGILPRPTARASIDRPTRADVSILATHLLLTAPRIKVHAPSNHHRVSLFVLAGDGPPAPALAAELTQQRTPHVAVTAGRSSAVLGPFVLPGRTSCLLCALRRRTDLDAGRPIFEEGLRHELVVPPAQLVSAAVAMAVSDALDHLDGLAEPRTLDGTMEWRLGDLAPRRRTWAVHPECGCNSLSANGQPNRI